LVALFAAYAMALQALLLPLSVAAGNPFVNSLCASSSGGTQQPAGHQSGCPCAAGCGMQCHGHGLVGATQPTVIPARTLAYAMTATAVLAPAERMFERRPQIPRAPPAA
jgi:hypothetical protein